MAAVLRQKAAAEATVRNPMQRLLVNRLGGFVGFADASSAEPQWPAVAIRLTGVSVAKSSA
jgi:hypothetical protein